MPITSVPKMSGATIDLIIRRKIVESGLRTGVKSRSGITLSAQPTRIPRAMPTKIQCVRVSLRSRRHIVVTQRPTSSPALASIPESNDRYEAANFATPSSSSSRVTAARSIPAVASAFIWAGALAMPSRIRTAGWP